MPEAAKETVQPELDLETIVDESNKNGTVITLDQTGKEVKTESVSADGKTSTSNAQPTAEETIESLKKQIEESKARELEKQDRIAKLESEQQTQIKKVTEAVGDAFKAKETSVENAITAAKNELDSVKRQLRDAREKGDIDKEIELEEKLADVRYQYNASMWQKDNLASLKKTEEERAKTVVANTNTDGTRKFSSREQQWINDHPRYNTDDDYQAFVWSLDAQAKRKGIIPDTDAYYDYLNTRIEKMFSDTASTGGQTVTVPAKTTNTASTAAPVSRGGTGGNGSGQHTQIRLTPEQLEAAEFMGMTPVEYAQDLINQQKEKAGR
jgi:hypothetical protein